MKNISIALLLVSITSFCSAQPLATPADIRMQNLSKLQTTAATSIFQNLPIRSIGPSVMSGRVTDIAVNPDDPTEFYVAYASGGLWKTINNGQSFFPLFDHAESITIGAIAVDWKNGETIWIGTGENNSSRSSYAGTGLYKSTDKGKTWNWMGLPESHHIGKILLDPNQPNTVLVAVMGHLYTANNERGIYKSTDAGKSWKQVLFVDGTTGAIELQRLNSNSSVIYAALWHRERKPWDFIESGASSGIYKSEDNGDTWQLITTPNSGFPTGKLVGRIGLAMSQQNSTKIYAIVDNQENQPYAKDYDTMTVTSRKLRNMSKEQFLATDSNRIKSFLTKNYFPAQLNYTTIAAKIKTAQLKPVDLANYVSDANTDLFDTPIKGAEIYVSTDAGKSWQKVNDGYLDGLYNSYGYYFGKIYCSPTNDLDVYVLGVPLLKSSDGGIHFKSAERENVHGDHHVLWIDPKKPAHIINGSDGGINITYDNGATWYKANTPAVGQFYAVAVDDAKPYNVYGGLQDNGVWTGPSTTVESNDWRSEGHYSYKRLFGGDGMQVQVDTRNNATVYTGYQFGHYSRINKSSGRAELSIHPIAQLGEEPFRYCWQTPICLSKHNQDILYMGSNRFHRSLQQGNKIETLSDDLTNGKKVGDVPYGTITCIAESPLKFGYIYVGTDDGNVYISKDLGYHFTKINTGLPSGLRVMRITPSKFEIGRVYVALSGFQFDHFAPYVFVSNDFGSTWAKLSANLPMEPVNVIKEDPTNKSILYVGTDNGLYISLNQGNSYSPLGGKFPRVAIHDLAIQENANEMLIGTHGRSLYIFSLNEIQQLSDSILNQDLVLLKSPETITYSSYWGKRWDKWEPTNDVNFGINFYAKNSGVATIEIRTDKGELVHTYKDSVEAGLNYSNYNLSVDSVNLVHLQNTKGKKASPPLTLKKADNGLYYLPVGTYQIKVMLANATLTKKLQIKKGKEEQEEEEVPQLEKE